MPASATEILERLVILLVTHFLTGPDPVTQVDMREAALTCQFDLAEDGKDAQRAPLEERVGIEEGIDRRQAMAEQVRGSDCHQMIA